MAELNAKLTQRNRRLAIAPDKYATTIYDLLVRIISPNAPDDRQTKTAKAMLAYLEGKVAEFTNLTGGDPVLFKQLQAQMEDLFWDNDAKYLDRVGELSATVFLTNKLKPARLSSLKQYYILKNNQIDHKGKDADMCFIDSDGGLILIDIFNINLKHERIEDAEGLTKILNNRINEKWKQKKFDDQGLHQRYKTIKIQPFLWLYDWDKIETYLVTVKQITSLHALTILILRQRSDAKGNIIFDCKSVDEL